MFSLFYADFFDAVALNSLKIICDLLIIRCSTSFGSQRLSLYIAEFFCELLAVFDIIVYISNDSPHVLHAKPL